MAETDHPLKQLVSSCIKDVAAWLLHTDIRAATSRNKSLHPPSEPIESDQVFFVTLADERNVLLHIEFQGHRSHRPMHRRMLDYQSRLALTYPDELVVSVVLYVGKGAGRHDSGTHQILQPDGRAYLTWHYTVIRLWEMDARTVIDLGNPALLPLIGQMRIHEPEQVIPQVLAKIKGVQERELRQQLLSALVALTESQEVLTMIEQLIADDDVLLDTPFLRRIRQQTWEKAHEEGQEEGRKEGQEEGRKEGQEEGRKEGKIATRRRDILEAVQVRFGLSDDDLRLFEQSLSTVDDETMLQTLFRTALLAERFEAVLSVLDHSSSPQAT